MPGHLGILPQSLLHTLHITVLAHLADFFGPGTNAHRDDTRGSISPRHLVLTPRDQSSKDQMLLPSTGNDPNHETDNQVHDQGPQGRIS